jgi:hypothetical protein
VPSPDLRRRYFMKMQPIIKRVLLNLAGRVLTRYGSAYGGRPANTMVRVQHGDLVGSVSISAGCLLHQRVDGTQLVGEAVVIPPLGPWWRAACIKCPDTPPSPVMHLGKMTTDGHCHLGSLLRGSPQKISEARTSQGQQGFRPIARDGVVTIGVNALLAEAAEWTSQCSSRLAAWSSFAISRVPSAGHTLPLISAVANPCRSPAPSATLRQSLFALAQIDRASAVLYQALNGGTRAAIVSGGALKIASTGGYP